MADETKPPAQPPKVNPPVVNPPAAHDAPATFSPYTGPSEIVEGGQYMRHAKLVRGKHMGGEIVNAHGDQLATFAHDQENTGRVEDGKKPE
jgi:hypothetical protein